MTDGFGHGCIILNKTSSVSAPLGPTLLRQKADTSSTNSLKERKEEGLRLEAGASTAQTGSGTSLSGGTGRRQAAHVTGSEDDAVQAEAS